MSVDPMVARWRALAAEPERHETWIEAGLSLWKAGRREEARAVLETVLERWPDDARGWIAAATATLSREAAEAAARRAVALASANAGAWLTLGETISSQAPDQALAAFETARELDPGLAAAHRGAGLALLRLGQPDEARKALERALALKPGDAASHRGLARRDLASGDAAAGWAHWAQGHPTASSDAEWNGGNIAGQVLTVIADGGLEESLRLFGLVPPLAEKTGKVRLAVPAAWFPLLAGLDGVAEFLPLEKKTSSTGPSITLNRLPWRMGWTQRTSPVLRLRAKAGTPLPVPAGTRLKVGVLWAFGQGEDELSVGLSALLPLLGVAGAAFYSLQTGARAADVRKIADPALLTDLSSSLKDLGDLAAAVAQLDLVVTVDGPMAYLAQALGKPVWLLAPRYADEAREESPSLRIFRQGQAFDWRQPVEDMRRALASLAAKQPLPSVMQTDIAIASIFPSADGTPRFQMTAPRRFYPDPGIRYLVDRERSGIGYEYATRSFIDAHLRPDDLFIDVGAHWGIMSLQAVTRWPGQVRGLAIEPSPVNLPHLKRWLADNGADGLVDVVHAFAADAPGKGSLKPQSTMGHSLIRDDDGQIPVVTVDSLLEGRPALAAAARVVVKIDVEGHEPEVIEGMKRLLGSGRVAAVIWERGREYDTPSGQERLGALRKRFDALGFTAWRFESEDKAGPLVPFVEDGRLGNIFELSAGLSRPEAYGAVRPAPVAQAPDFVLDANWRARALFARGLEAHKANKTADAQDLYRQAAALDGDYSAPYNNLGALLRDQANRPAAAVAFQRALRLGGGDLGVMSNCANALREVGQFDTAERMLRSALAQKPDDAGLIYNLGVVRKDTDRPGEAVALFERALLVRSDDPEYRWDRSLALLQSGDYVRGFDAYESRWGLKRAAKKKIQLPVWDGSALEGRSIFLSDEQGFGDVLQWARFIPDLKRRGAGRIVMECQPELMRLMSLLPEVDAVVPRAKEVPACDLTLPLLSLPRIFGTTLETLPAVVPYLKTPQPVYRLPDDGRIKVGIAWAGKTTPRDRSIGLEKLLPLLGDPRIAAYALQKGPRAGDIAKFGAELLISDLAPQLTDFAETGAILEQLDLLITIDSAIAHLAGALGVRTLLMLRKVSDWRWFDRRSDSPWYPTMKLFRQTELDRWDEVVKGVGEELSAEVDAWVRSESRKGAKSFAVLPFHKG